MAEIVRDVFLSHASVDKELYVRPFARTLNEYGISYWLDEAEIRWGDRITRKINDGLHKSKYVVVFLSPSFLGRNWPEAELESALNKENSMGQTIVLPLIIGDPTPIIERYPLLRDKLFLEWKDSPAAIANHLRNLLSSSQLPPNPTIFAQPGKSPEENKEILPVEADVPEQIRQLRNAIKADSNNPDLYARLGDLLLQREHWDDAANAFRDALSFQPSVSEWNYKLGIALLELNRWPEAEDALQKAHEQDAKNVDAQKALVAVFLNLKKWESALNELRDLSALRPKDNDIKDQIDYARSNLLLELYAKGVESEADQPVEAKRYFERAYYLSPSYADVADRLEEVKSRITFETLTDDSEKHAHLGRRYFAKRKLEEARSEFVKAVDLQPTNQLYHALLGRVYAEQENWNKAEACFERALEIGPVTAVRYFELGCAAYGQEQWKKAERYFAKALQLDPNSLLYEMNLTKARNKQLIRAFARLLKNILFGLVRLLGRNLIWAVVLLLFVLAAVFILFRFVI